MRGVIWSEKLLTEPQIKIKDKDMKEQENSHLMYKEHDNCKSEFKFRFS